LAHPDELRQTIATAARLPEPVVARQLERTDLSHAAIGAAQEQTIIAAGLALQQAGVIAGTVEVPAAAEALVAPSFSAKLAAR
jgi:sulfonate transport system substrate-binding protein